MPQLSDRDALPGLLPTDLIYASQQPHNAGDDGNISLNELAHFVLSNARTLQMTGDINGLGLQDRNIQILDPNGVNRNVILNPEGSFFFINDSDGTFRLSIRFPILNELIELSLSTNVKVAWVFWTGVEFAVIELAGY